MTEELLDVIYQQRKKLEKIEGLILEAGTVKGGHHKAWYIDQIARMFPRYSDPESITQSDIWDEGIAP